MGMMGNNDTPGLSRYVERDLRLDLFRGIGLWMIFLDHVPHDVVAWLTLRNYGFSDAAEFFVFISGYLAGYIYGPIVRGGRFLAATKRVEYFCWDHDPRGAAVGLVDGRPKLHGPMVRPT